MLTKATAHIRPFIRPLQNSGAGPDHFTANPSLLHHLPYGGAGNSLVAQGPNPTQTAGSSGSAGRHGYGGNAGAGGGYTGHARAFLSLPQTTSVDPSSTLSNSDDNQLQESSSNKSSLLLKHRLSKRTRIVGPNDGVGREVRREIEARAGGSKVTVMELEGPEEGERSDRLALPSSSASSSRTPLRPSTPSRQARAGLTRSPSAVEIWQVGIPQPRGRLGLRSLSTRSDIPKSLEAEDVQPLVSANSTPSTRVLGQPNRVLMDLAGRDVPGKRLGMVRRNSTAAVERASLDQPPVELLLQKTDGSDRTTLNSEPREVAIHDAIMKARDTGDVALLDQLVQHYRSPRSVSPFSQDQQAGIPALSHQYPLSEGFSVRTYNACLNALVTTRKAGQSIAEILEIYNEILEHDLVPNNVTYGFVIRALALRSVEVSEAVKLWEEQKSWGEWRAQLVGPQTWDFDAAAEKDQLFKSYEAEGNLASAHKLFRAATRVNSTAGFPLTVYGTILDAMSREAQPDVKGMTQIFSMANRWSVPGVISLYKHMFRALGAAKDVEQLESTWKDFRKTSQSGNPQQRWLDASPASKSADPAFAMQRVDGLRIQVWQTAMNAFIVAGQPSKALEILQRMMETASSTTAEGIDFARPPAATHRTLGKFLVDLARAGQVDLAMEWFAKFHSADYLGKLPPHRLTLEHTSGLADAIIKANRVDDAKRVVESLSLQYGQFTTAASKTTVGRRLWRIYTALVVRANEVSGQEREKVLDEIKSFSQTGNIPLDMLVVDRHFGLLAKSGRWDDLPSVLEGCTIRETPTKALQSALNRSLLALSATDIPLKTLLTVTHQVVTFGVPVETDVASAIVAKFIARDTTEKLDISSQDLFVLVESFAGLPQSKINEGEYDDAFLSLLSVLEDGNRADGFVTKSKNHIAVRTIIGSITHRFGIERSKHLLTPVFGESEAEQLTAPIVEPISPSSSTGSPVSDSSEFTLPSATSSATSATSGGQPEYKLSLDKSLSHSIERITQRNPPITPLDAYAILQKGLTRNTVPFPNTICQLIDHLSRLGDEPKVRELYSLCQVILQSVIRPESQASNWHQVEDAMLIANCHLGHLEQAGMHRARIVEAGMAPSADAYATMIASSKDTTDDALVARELFDESQMMGVKPHLYLYNTIISKLSKARKAETALELFAHMKNQGIRPSSVTYGAVINACCRVGDAQSAETLFEEMASQPNFKARVPPFNTMMQFYLQTQPNRARVLHYYNLLQRAHVPPSAHTYKLLLDTYATLAPIDLEAMENVFSQIQQDRHVQVQGTHWASIITAYGIYGGNLEKSKEIFESIPSNGIKEAVVWEAMLNVISQKGSIEDLEHIREKMIKFGVQPTAYVYNALINGYSRSGNIEKAREVFDSMGDSISGVAAPNNHPTLLTSSGHVKPNTQTDIPTGVVYREPSTYESMIKAEVAHGDRERAKVVLDKMEERGYPLAVFLRGKNAFDEGIAV
uniref:Pentatricopeptide repeat protein n=1 Tax=Kwoniella bestiolae CBS 10118 TaxID=1296100 RepID=A0A1B9GDI3_9TREE|nr:hypothetical protein I302_00544 [Kwoniella bestiolae CBS 10118]OCF29053.1 hypothetical protein I302_00544 [Kwoniella bestiolae CBS 10118]